MPCELRGLARGGFRRIRLQIDVKGPDARCVRGTRALIVLLHAVGLTCFVGFMSASHDDRTPLQAKIPESRISLRGHAPCMLRFDQEGGWPGIPGLS